MKRRKAHQVLGLLAIGLLAQPGQAQGDDLPAAEDLLDRHVEATGGKDAHLRLKGRKKTGRLAVDMAGHVFDAQVVEHFQAPNKSHILIDGSFFSQVSVCDGKDAWDWRPGHAAGTHEATEGLGETTLLEGPERARALEKADFHGAVHWRDAFTSVKTIGVAEVAGAPAFEVQVERKGGEPYSQFYDKESGRLVKRVRKTSSHGEPLDMEVILSDYREFDGLWMATKVHANLRSPSFGEGTQTWTYTQIEHGEEIPDSLFERPAELSEHEHEGQHDHDHAE